MPDFIPEPYKKEAVTVRVNCKKLNMIDAFAISCDISRSELMNQYIDYAWFHDDGSDLPEINTNRSKSKSRAIKSIVRTYNKNT